jgi:NADH-quinone oxidoreductase subunit D/NADH-quinone oxidoreductase subunit C/D
MADTSPEAPEIVESDAEAFLNEKFPGAIEADAREGYEGFIVKSDKLVEVATALRDDLGYDYLTSATAVDYIEDDQLEMVYHACSVGQGGPPITFKAQTARDTATLPSLVEVWPGADFQEREAWDLIGIRFEGHPNLKRILTWEGFAGHPLRKDWKEPYFEEDVKPFGSRWPGGDVWRSEQHNAFGRNLRYPAGFEAEEWVPETDKALYEDMMVGADVERHQIKTDELVVNLGPQHPSTHGVFRMVVTMSGETITKLEPVMGYLHRNHEQIGERNTFLQNMPYTDRLDYICSMSNNFGYALTVEKLMGIEVPERAELLRVLMAELTRIVNHYWAIGFLLNDMGAFQTPAVYAIIERELIVDLFEAVSGSRMMCNYMRFGGVMRDLPSTIGGPLVLEGDKPRDIPTMDFISDLVFERLPRKIDELDAYLSNNEILRTRSIGVGLLPAEQAIAYSAAGPVLRASGVPYDVRRADPYSIYDELDFDVAVRYGCDVYDRYMIRIDEMRESLRILEQVIPRLEATEGQPVMTGKNPYQVRVPAGESYGRVENPKGELGYYVVSNGKPNPWRYHIRAPSFINLTAFGKMCEGVKVADSVVILGSIDIVLGEVDR